MPYHVKVWLEDCDDGSVNLYADESVVNAEGAVALERILNAAVVGWQRLDNATVRRALRAVTG